MTLAEDYMDDVPQDALSNGSAYRLRRVWQLVEFIAAHPGHSRSELAIRFCVSERQTQADLNLIRREMGLPLVRREGYRFATDQLGPQLTVADMELLLLVVGRALHDPTLPQGRVEALITALPSLFPAYLRPLLRTADGEQSALFMALSKALVAKTWVRLEYRLSAAPNPPQPIVRPEVIFPYVHHWYVLGECRQRGRLMLFPLESLQAVSAA